MQTSTETTFVTSSSLNDGMFLGYQPNKFLNPTFEKYRTCFDRLKKTLYWAVIAKKLSKNSVIVKKNFKKGQGMMISGRYY